jgi:positive regulator of sigma E activity
MTRLLVLGAALLFIVGFAFLTYGAILHEGLGAGSVLSIFILVLLTVGIVGALRHPPRR